MPVAVSQPRPRPAHSLYSNHSLAPAVTLVKFPHCPFCLLSSDLWTNVSVVKPRPRSSDEMGTCVCVCVPTQYTSTSCWIGVTSPHWDLICYLTAIWARVCALVNVSEAWCATWQQPPPLQLQTHTLTIYIHTHIHTHTHMYDTSMSTDTIQCTTQRIKPRRISFPPQWPVTICE